MLFLSPCRCFDVQNSFNSGISKKPIPSSQLGKPTKVGIVWGGPIDTLLRYGRRLPLLMHADEALSLVTLAFEPSLTPSSGSFVLDFARNSKLKTRPLEHYDKKKREYWSSIMANEMKLEWKPVLPSWLKLVHRHWNALWRLATITQVTVQFVTGLPTVLGRRAEVTHQFTNALMRIVCGLWLIGPPIGKASRTV